MSVKERLPEDMSDVLVYDEYSDVKVGYFHDRTKQWVVYGNEYPSTITHYMPLPQPPKQ